MSASILGSICGAFVGVYIVSRLMLWILRRLGHSPTRIGLAHGITLVLALGLWAFSPANSATASRWTWLAYVGATAVWLGVDLVALKGRQVVPATRSMRGRGLHEPS